MSVCLCIRVLENCRTGPAYSLFPGSLSPLWSWALPGHVIPFWKAFDKANNNLKGNFLFWAKTCTGSYTGTDYKEGHNVFANWPFFIKIDPLSSNSKNFCDLQLFIGPLWSLVLMNCFGKPLI